MTTYYMQDKHDHYRYTRISKPRAYWEWCGFHINQHLDGTLELSIVPLIVLPDNNKGVSIMDEETEVYTIYQRVTQIEKRHVTAPKGLTFNQLSDWVDENGVGDLLDIDELDNDMVSADYEDGSHVKRKWVN